MKLRITLALLCVICASTAGAALESSQIHEALSKKTQSYLREGIITGGDREIRGGIIKDVRRATDGAFERIVIDVDSEQAPYYQVALEPNRRRILVTIFGGPKIAIDAKKVVDEFRRSPLVARVELFPMLEDDAWTFALNLRAAVPVEVFELTAPTRIIFDLKGGAALLSERGSDQVAHSKPIPRKSLRNARTASKHSKKVSPPKASYTTPVNDDSDENGAATHDDDIPE